MDNTTTKKNNTLKMVAIVVIFFGVGIAAAYLYNLNGSEGPKQAAQQGQVARAAGGGKPVLGFSAPPLTTSGDVQEYMRKVRNTPVPDNYPVPEYISAATNYDEAMMVLNQRFPDFSNKEGSELIKAVWDQPVIYQTLMVENKLARLQFMPELRSDSTYMRQH